MFTSRVPVRVLKTSRVPLEGFRVPLRVFQGSLVLGLVVCVNVL